MKANKYFTTALFISGMIFLFSRCINSAQRDTEDARGVAYAGSVSCLQCHKSINDSYRHTAHNLTSRQVNDLQENIFTRAGRYVYNESTVVAIEKRDSGVFQVAYINGKEAAAKRFDIAFGSGEKAFSFGYWQDKKVYQLPLSYFTAIHGWANSPGFPMHQPNFNRPIISRCFECHGSYIAADREQDESLAQARNLDKQFVIFGIDCERCHGPASDHVAFHTQNLAIKQARYIAGWKSLSRQQKLDVCAVCHSGNDLTTQRSTFAFRPGDTLSKFYYPEFSSFSSAAPDVHGKQVQLLAASQCFLQSKTMECTSCHNTHTAGPRSMAVYSRQCVSCHKQTDHTSSTMAAGLGNAIVNNCIDCHMPRQESNAISFQEMGKQNANSYLLRTHRIAIYPEEAQRKAVK